MKKIEFISWAFFNAFFYEVLTLLILYFSPVFHGLILLEVDWLIAIIISGLFSYLAFNKKELGFIKFLVFLFFWIAIAILLDLSALFYLFLDPDQVFSFEFLMTLFFEAITVISMYEFLRYRRLSQLLDD